MRLCCSIGGLTPEHFSWSQNKSLEQESSTLEKDKKHLEKEVKRLRQQAEIRDGRLEDSSQRLACLEKENRSMGKEMIFFRDSCTRVRELEKETKELVKQSSIDKRTLVTLREVRSQRGPPPLER